MLQLVDDLLLWPRCALFTYLFIDTLFLFVCLLLLITATVNIAQITLTPALAMPCLRNEAAELILLITSDQLSQRHTRWHMLVAFP